MFRSYTFRITALENQVTNATVKTSTATAGAMDTDAVATRLTNWSILSNSRGAGLILIRCQHARKCNAVHIHIRFFGFIMNILYRTKHQMLKVSTIENLV